MYDWVYIATPSGAPLGRTIKLAKGRIFGVGLIRRRIADDIPHLDEVVPGHKILLTYDLFHSGVIYPIGLFTVIKPDHPSNPYVRKHRDYPALGEMTRLRDLEKLDSATYISDGSNETVMLGTFADLTAEHSLKVYCRNIDIDHALHMYSSGPIMEIDEDDCGHRLEQMLVPGDQSTILHALEEQIPYVKYLDGRGKQLLLECVKAEKAFKQHSSYALPAYPLAMLVEYEIQRLLAKVARKRLSANPSLGVGKLSWIPEPSVHEYHLTDSISILMDLIQTELEYSDIDVKMLRKCLADIRYIRNRIAHSYFLEKVHYLKLQQLVTDVLEVLHPLITSAILSQLIA